MLNDKDHHAAPQTDKGRRRTALRRRNRPRSALSALSGRTATELVSVRPAALGLAAGDRVRCAWSGKVGTVLDPQVRVDRHWPGALVLLDPFLPDWPDPATIAGLEVIYRPHDLERVTDT